MISKFLSKQVHVDFFNDKTGQLEWVEGKCNSFCEEDLDFGEDVSSKNLFVEIESDTDFQRICFADVRKVYLK